MQPSDVQRAYSRMSSRYIDLFASGSHEHVDDLRLIVRHLGGLSGTVADLGCGPGHLTGLLQSTGANAHGIDLVPEFIDHARRAQPSATFDLGSVMDLPFEDGTVAGALAWYSLIHLDAQELAAALTEIRRVLGSGRPLVVGFFVGEVSDTFAHKVITARRWPIDAMAAHLEAAGFAEVERLERGQNGDRRPHGALAALTA